MYPPSSSSSQKSIAQSGLTRYGSAPGSFLTSAVDAVIRGDREFSAAVGSRPPLGHYFSGADSSSVTSESNCKVNSSSSDLKHPNPKGALQRSYGLHDADAATALGFSGSSAPSSALLRQRSSPAGFLSHLASPPSTENGAGTFVFSLSLILFFLIYLKSLPFFPAGGAKRGLVAPFIPPNDGFTLSCLSFSCLVQG